jgi:hypothetical protein
MPNYTSARLNYAETLWLQGRFEEAFAETDLALVYDPLSPSVRMARAMCLCLARRHAESRQEWAVFRASGETSQWGMIGAGYNELLDWDIDAGEAMLDACLARFPGLPAPMMARAYAHALRGNAGAARALERECYSRFPHHSPSDRAHVAALLRDKPAVIAHMVAAQATHDMSYLTLSILPALAWLADDGMPCGLSA